MKPSRPTDNHILRIQIGTIEQKPFIAATVLVIIGENDRFNICAGEARMRRRAKKKREDTRHLVIIKHIDMHSPLR